MGTAGAGNAGAATGRPDLGAPPLLVWWVIWLGLLAGFLQVWQFGRRVTPQATTPAGEAAVALVGVGFLTLSAAIRWLLLPRMARARGAFIFFIVGQALAEACGYFGVFLGGSHRELLVAGGILGLLQFLPRFARRFFVAPAAAFRP